MVARMMPLFVFGGALISVLVAAWEDHKNRKARKARR
jgi:hypothetical protein